MAEMTPELRAAIDTAKQRVKVDSYYTKAMNSALRGNAQGYWSGTLLGAVTGAAAGGLITLAMVVGTVAFPPGIGALAIIGGLAGIGGTMGAATGTRLGGGAAAVAGVAAERERRDKAEQLEQKILNSPALQQEVIEAYRANPVVEKSDTLCETFATSDTPGKAWGKLVNWKSMALIVGLCVLGSVGLFAASYAIGGGIAAGGLVGSVASGLGAIGMTSWPSTLAIGAGAGGAMGLAFSVNYPMIFGSLTGKTADLLSGKMLSGKSDSPHVKTVDELYAEAAQNRAASEAQAKPTLRIYADQDPGTQVHHVAAIERVAQAEQQLTA